MKEKRLWFLVFILVVSVLITVAGKVRSSTVAEEPMSKEIQNETEWMALHPQEYRNTIFSLQDKEDHILLMYHDTTSRDSVITFFEAITNSRRIAEILLSYADEFEVSPALVFALSWEESKFNPRAVNRNKTSIDRGLFQLNSKSFPKLQERDFFDPDINAQYGIAHLRWCLDTGGSEVAGLAMYNAGTNRVKADNTPKSTLDYISRIQTYQNGIEKLFTQELKNHWNVANNTVQPAGNQFSLAHFLNSIR
jgi:hypothetical protein